MLISSTATRLVRCFRRGVRIVADVGIALVISEDDHQVGLLPPGGEENEEKEDQSEMDYHDERNEQGESLNAYSPALANENFSTRKKNFHSRTYSDFLRKLLTCDSMSKIIRYRR